MNKRLKLIKKENQNLSLEIDPNILNVDHTMSFEFVKLILT
jgi:hypothetical protein